MPAKASANFLRALQRLGEQFARNNGLAASVSSKSAKPSKPWASRQPAVQAKQWRRDNWERLQINLN
jgi:hypothetical protein